MEDPNAYQGRRGFEHNTTLIKKDYTTEQKITTGWGKKYNTQINTKEPGAQKAEGGTKQ